MKQDYPGADHPRSQSVREEDLLPAIGGWLNQLFTDDAIEHTCEVLHSSRTEPNATAEEFEAHRTIKECNAELDNYRSALKTAPSDTVAQWIAETEEPNSEPLPIRGCGVLNVSEGRLQPSTHATEATGWSLSAPPEETRGYAGGKDGNVTVGSRSSCSTRPTSQVR